MTTIEALLQELTVEAQVTRRFLERVPLHKSEYKPTEKSEPLGRLAVHVAEIVAWWKSVVQEEYLDFRDFTPQECRTTEELLAYFDKLLAEATAALATAREEDLATEWSMTHGEEVLFTLPKTQVLRLFCMNHLVHHRAQLGMYLRLLNVPVPATYGPSADDEEVILITRFSRGASMQ